MVEAAATQVAELSYLHSRDITYAVFCQGPTLKPRYRHFMGWDLPWYSAAAGSPTALMTKLPVTASNAPSGSGRSVFVRIEAHALITAHPARLRAGPKAGGAGRGALRPRRAGLIRTPRSLVPSP